ncbi:hypothetical protein AWB73_02826 [Caballeronia turbans]|jgi:hypothetical protein|nr:hypothetical protein AWB73_02826 [Caballeronia turbans]
MPVGFIEFGYIKTCRRIMPTKLEFATPEGRLSLSILDAQFMAYDAGELAYRSTRDFVARMQSMGLGELAQTYARLLAQNKVSVMELHEAREDAQACLEQKDEGGVIAERILPRLEEIRETIARTQLDMRANVERLAALSAACDRALRQIPGYRPPARVSR